MLFGFGDRDWGDWCLGVGVWRLRVRFQGLGIHGPFAGLRRFQVLDRSYARGAYRLEAALAASCKPFCRLSGSTKAGC